MTLPSFARIRACAGAIGAAVLLAGCATAPPPLPPPPPPQVGLVPCPDWQGAPAHLVDDAEFAALPDALRQSLRYYRRLRAGTTFTYGGLAYTAQEMAASTELLLSIVENLEGDARDAAIREKFLLFESRNDRGGALFTGYYEPVLAGSLAATERFKTPLYAVPADLLSIDLAAYVDAGILPADLRGKSLRGKLDGKKLIPYDDRSRIATADSLDGRAEPLVWIDDEIELFFLQIQGSGLIRLEDGSQQRVNFADQNGHPYRAIGKLLKERIPPDQMSLQSLKAWLRAHPEQIREILDYNPSYVFFRRVTDGPLGNIQVPLTAGRSLAMDHRLLPRGGIAWIETTLPASFLGGPGAVRRFGVVQDTGGAITGHGRVDIFWGTGDEAGRIAGGFKQDGRVFLLVARKEFLTR